MSYQEEEIRLRDKLAKFKKLAGVKAPEPMHVQTTSIIETNGLKSVIKKEDRTFCLKNETTGKEHGRFLTQEEALTTFDDIINEEDDDQAPSSDVSLNNNEE